ncbi:hypothetical protein SK128_007736 [Halocaridina rubra]|uniref:Uncharacterized protein n=1 Tax=Halocaridina rubra TaxID=373956 RepID=A0AAN8ZX19_HALRR
MMKIVVLAMALTAVSAGTHLTVGFPLAGRVITPLSYHSAATPAFLPAAVHAPVYSAGVPAAPLVAPAPVTYVGAPAAPLVAPAQVAYAAAPAAPLVAPAPYQVQTGVRTDVAVEPVEQHGYVIKY